LDAVLQAILEVSKERVAVGRIARTDEPRGDKLGLRIDGNPSPHVAIAELVFVLDRDVLGLGVDELPNLIDLDASRVQVAKRLVLVVRAHLAKVSQKSNDGVLCDAGYAYRGPDRYALDKAGNHLATTLCSAYS